MLALAGLVVMAVLGAGVVCWSLVLLRLIANAKWAPVPLANVARGALDQAQLSAGSPLIPWAERRPVPWALIDMGAIIALYLVIGLATGMVLRQSGWLPKDMDRENLALDQRQLLVATQVAISLLLIAVALPLMILRSGAKASDLGWSWRELRRDVRLGVIAFAMLAPPVYAIQALVVQFWPSKHPLMEMFRGTPEPQFFALLVLAAVIVAPIFEELVFRVLLQGFLENVFSFQLSAQALIFGAKPQSIRGSEKPAPLSEGIEPLAPYAPHANPYAPPHALDEVGADGLPAEGIEGEVNNGRIGPLRGIFAILPMAISALIFALLHEWPDQIPLVFLAVGLGFLYQRTHRIVPSLVVHALLNGLSMWGLWIQVFETPT